MNKFTALKSLDSANANDRLVAARFLAKNASVEDVDLIERALRKENVSWVRNALAAAVERAIGDFEPQEDEAVEEGLKGQSLPSDKLREEIYSNALQEITTQLLHEIEPLLGIARLYAEREVRNFEQSKTKKQLDHLDLLLTAFSNLRKASTPATVIEMELGALMREAIEQEVRGHEVEVQVAGPSPFNVIADRGRLWLAVTNGFRNAIEATELVDKKERRPIVVNWNQTDQDFWISIIDHGAGIKASLERIFEIGTSSKREHAGMGLPTARQAVLSMGGRVAVTPREDVGVKYEVRWPRYVTASS
jgi:signal transduction histidine kinase